MILTRDFLLNVNSCLPGYRFGLQHNLIGKDYDYAIQYCKNNGGEEFADWLEAQKNTEIYVRANGVNVTMKAFQLFNPMTGMHTKYETEEEAKAALIAVAKQVLEEHCPRVVQELVNENGDATWVPTTIHEQINITI